MQSEMHTLRCTVGHWRAEARVQEIETGKLMAVISVTDETGAEKEDSRHTVVFEHATGMDTLVETEELVRSILRTRYGV